MCMGLSCGILETCSPGVISFKRSASRDVGMSWLIPWEMNNSQAEDQLSSASTRPFRDPSQEYAKQELFSNTLSGQRSCNLLTWNTRPPDGV